MRGDFTRYGGQRKDFTRVMMQQGRPQVDADWNEQVDIFWGFLRTLAADLIGPHAGPEENCGFRILAEGDFPMTEKGAPASEEQDRLKSLLTGAGDFLVGPGAYYVDGLRCTNSRFLTYVSQSGPGESSLQKGSKVSCLVYLDAWEIHRTDIEEEAIREVALLGTDTSTRAKLVWRIGVLPLNDYGKTPTCALVKDQWQCMLDQWQPRNRGRLKVRAIEPPEGVGTEPGTLSPDSRYRGVTNQLYRVEIHQGDRVAADGGPTFKFSRENGSVIFPVRHVDSNVVTLSRWGRDTRSGVQVGDWVELVDDEYELHRRAEPLLQVKQTIPGKMQVILSAPPKSNVGQDPGKHPLLRRWDHKEGDARRGGLELRHGAAILKEGEHGDSWFHLENGIQVQFEKSEPASIYRTGDYWTIPARVASGDVVWPDREGKPEARGPQGVEHAYAPLAIVSFNSKGVLGTESDCRLRFKLPMHYGESAEP